MWISYVPSPSSEFLDNTVTKSKACKYIHVRYRKNIVVHTPLLNMKYNLLFLIGILFFNQICWGMRTSAVAKVSFQWLELLLTRYVRRQVFH